MTGNRIFEKMCAIMCESTNAAHMVLDKEIDEETLTEGYEIHIPESFFKGGLESVAGEHCKAMIVMMEVKYDYALPSQIIFYTDEYKTPVISYKINSSLENIFGISRELMDDEWCIGIIKNAVIPLFEEVCKKVIYHLVETM